MSSPSIFQAAVKAKLFGKKQTGKLYSDGKSLYFFPYSLDHQYWQMLASSSASVAIALALFMSSGLGQGAGMEFLQGQSISFAVGLVGYPLLMALLIATGLNVRGYLKQRAVVREMGMLEEYLGADLEERAELDPSCIVVPIEDSEMSFDQSGMELVTSDGDRIRMEPLTKDAEFGRNLARIHQRMKG